ncbi:hypothetical protein ACVW0B_002595 [Thermostichus sp. MS-CIW-23]|jgi:hypothetical protein
MNDYVFPGLISASWDRRIADYRSDPQTVLG